MPLLFKNSFRGNQREVRAECGSGFGLTTVRSIAERHGGKVWVESVLGQGNTIFLPIPFTRPYNGDPLSRSEWVIRENVYNQ